LLVSQFAILLQTDCDGRVGRVIVVLLSSVTGTWWFAVEHTILPLCLLILSAVEAVLQQATL
jgi:hypothetical protein